MGDRVLTLFTDGRELSPVIYQHWGGGSIAEDLRAALPVFRTGDLAYTAARFVGFLAKQSPEDNKGLGIFNAPEGECEAAMKEIQGDEFSHGDAGVVVVDIRDWVAKCYNGYGFQAGREPPVMELQLDGSKVPA